jgi:hypothetical protein
MVAAHPQLQTSIAAVVCVTIPLFRALERVGNNILHGKVLAVCDPVVVGRYGNIVNLRSPPIACNVVCIHVQEVILHEFCEDGIFRVRRLVQRISTFAGGVGCRRAQLVKVLRVDT